MRYVFDNDLHIHSKISLCSGDPEQTSMRILEYAKENSLKTICLTDHFWDENVQPPMSQWYAKQDYNHIRAALPLPRHTGIRFLFGCETEMDMNMRLGLSKERFSDFDFIVVPINHFHMKGETIPKSMTEVKDIADFWLKRFEALLNMDLPFHKIGMAHLTCSLMMQGHRDKLLELIDTWKTENLQRIFTIAAKKGVGIELNSRDMKFEDFEADTILRPYKIARDAGCKFYMGSDAHHPKELDNAKEIFERAIDLLGLTENEKFSI